MGFMGKANTRENLGDKNDKETDKGCDEGNHSA
jgi:hypothetical protein